MSDLRRIFQICCSSFALATASCHSTKAASEAPLLENQADGVKVYLGGIPRFVPRINKWANVRFDLTIENPKSTTFVRVGTSYEGNCSGHELSAIHAAAIARDGSFVSMETDEMPFKPKPKSVELKALRVACELRGSVVPAFKPRH